MPDFVVLSGFLSSEKLIKIIRFLWTRFSNQFPAGLKTEDCGNITASESYISSSACFADTQSGEASGFRGEKTIVKRSVIGNNTYIGARALITGSVIMESCNIGSR